VAEELSVVRKTYDLILWYVPLLNRLPRSHRFALGERMVANLHDLLEGLLAARYRRDKALTLEGLTGKLDGLRYQTRLLKDFELIDLRRYEHVAGLLRDIGREVGAWTRAAAARGVA